MDEVTRRGFLAGAGTAAAGAALAEVQDDKLTDGGLADVTPPGMPARKAPLVPPGARSLKSFSTRCVGCQLCVNVCPNGVLRMSKDGKRALQPEMGFERGWCRPECVKCGEVCPAGAIRAITPQEKRTIHVGHAIWHKDRCLAMTDGIACTACFRHCPAQAITLVPLDERDKKSPKIPVIDKIRCIGCGACEHLCPARPMPAMTLKGFEVHREVKPMGEADVLAEAKRLIGSDRAGCVLVKDGVIVAAEKGPGVKPILFLHDNRAGDLKGAWVVDKVVGRAAAAIMVLGGAVRVHGLLMSEGAKAFLEKQGVKVSADQMVPQILNRKRDGLCPLEDSVKDLEAPDKMLPAIRARIKKLMADKAKAEKTKEK